MAVELGNQFKSVASLGPSWVVRRILTGPGMIPHAILTQNGDASSIRTLSIRALEDRNLFEPANDAPRTVISPARAGGTTVRGLLRITKKAA